MLSFFQILIIETGMMNKNLQKMKNSNKYYSEKNFCNILATYYTDLHVFFYTYYSLTC